VASRCMGRAVLDGWNRPRQVHRADDHGLFLRPRPRAAGAAGGSFVVVLVGCQAISVKNCVATTGGGGEGAQAYAGGLAQVASAPPRPTLARPAESRTR
jgi:hypothetical protein